MRCKGKKDSTCDQTQWAVDKQIISSEDLVKYAQERKEEHNRKYKNKQKLDRIQKKFNKEVDQLQTFD